MAPLRLAALGLLHESNTFARVATDMAAFERAGVLRGEQIRARHSDAQTTMAGFLDLHDDNEVVVEPLLFTFANPRGPIESSAFQQLCREMLDQLSSRGPWDGVLLAQHGAAVSEEPFNADAYITARVREVVGPDVPIGLAMDLHGNISPALIEASSVVSSDWCYSWSQVSGSPRALSSSAFRSRPGTLVSSEVLARVLS